MLQLDDLQIKKYLQRKLDNGTPLAVLSSNYDCTPFVLQNFLNGNDTPQISSCLCEIIASTIIKEMIQYDDFKFPYYKTKAYYTMNNTLQKSLNINCLYLVIGNKGFGKTAAINNLRKSYIADILFLNKPDSILNLKPASIKHTICIDNSETITTAQYEKIDYLHHSNKSIVLIGREDMLKCIDQRMRKKAIRVDIPGISKKEVNSILNLLDMDFSKEAREILTLINPSILRLLYIIKEIKKIAKGKLVDIEILQKAGWGQSF